MDDFLWLFGLFRNFYVWYYFLFFTLSFCWKTLEVVYNILAMFTMLAMGYFMSCHPFSNLCSPQMLTSSGFSIIKQLSLLETGVRIGFSNLPLVLCEPFTFSKWKAQSHWCSADLLCCWAPSRDLGAGGCCCCCTILAVQSNQDLLSSLLTRIILLI